MTSNIPDEEISNYETFRGSISALLVQRLSQHPQKPHKSKPKTPRRSKQTLPASLEPTNSSEAEDLSDFIEYIATEIFTTLPSDLRTLTNHTWTTTPTLQSTYAFPLTA